MKRIELHCTFDRSDCTQQGYVFSIGKDRAGYYRLYATYETRWKGKRTGGVWRSPCSAELISVIKEELNEYLNMSWCDLCDIVQTWESVKRGYIVQ